VFLGWWEYGFRSWLARSQDIDILTFTCELGPRPYAIVNEKGDDLSDRWQEALLLRTLVRNLWDRVLDVSKDTVAA
jgi:hypothetical protein